MDKYKNVIVVVLVLIIVGLLGNAAINYSGNGNDSAQVADASVPSASSLNIGDCFNYNTMTNAEGVSAISGITAMACSAPHDNEIFSVSIVDEEVFPGSDTLERLARSYCVENFAAFIGVAYGDSIFGISYLYPSEQSWTDEGERALQCSVFDLSGNKMMGSVRGVAR
ncbi:MAG: septum formation family protein [Gammaproteobacteria bacterium]|nr:septum formation family protein [Gammaproteobacteria bacterium]MDD9894581.1 septum formation family protein [Gammaproteobacteria bacterium]MDD9957829.1 septum formation family protein [Gammaproteobacteria bacterium]